MTVAVGTYISGLTGGFWTLEATAPTTPTITAANDGTGTSVTVTVDGDAGVTNRLYYRATTATAWTTGLTRSGDGTIIQTGLTNATAYAFVVVSDSSGTYSLPSSVALGTTAATSDYASSLLSTYIDDDTTATVVNADGFDTTKETQTVRIHRRGRRMRVRLTEYGNTALEVVGITVVADVLDHE